MTKDYSNSPKIIKIIHTADFHLGATFKQIIGPKTEEKRREDFKKNLKYIIDTAIKRNVDLFLISGDIFQRSDPSPKDFVDFARQVGRLAEAGIHTVIIAGNHDKPKIAGAQNPLQGLVEAKAPFFHYVQSLPETPLILDVKDSKIGIVPIPYIDPRIVQMLSGISYEGFIKEKIGTLKDHPEIKDADYTILMAHLILSGAKVSDDFLRYGEEPRVGRGSLYEDHFDYIALGHVHKPQKIGNKICYPGSIERLNFAEEKENKSFLYIEIKPDNISIEEIPLHCRPMITKSVSIAEEVNPIQVILSVIKSLNIEPGTILRLVLEANINTWRKIEKEWNIVEDELLNNLNLFGYSLVRKKYGIPERSLKPIEPRKIPLRTRILEYIDSLVIDERIKKRAKELAEEFMNEVELT